MKKVVNLMMIAAAILFISACSQQEIDEEPQFLDVQLNASPEKGQIGEEITFEAKVTYGDEEVEDAEEVEFEIWRAHAEEHEKIPVEHSEKGIYRLNKSFSEEGTYYIISHVTARSMHSMPKVEFIVGNPSEPEDGSESNAEDDEDPGKAESENEESEKEHSGH